MSDREFPAEHKEKHEKLVEKIKQRRLNRGWTQQDLAEKIDKAHITVQAIEQHRRSMSLWTLWDICDAFDTTIPGLLQTRVDEE